MLHPTVVLGGGAPSDGGLHSCHVSDWPDHPRDDIEMEAVFRARPDARSVRLVLKGDGGEQTVLPDDVDYEHGLWVFEFDFYIPSGTWTPTLHWSVDGAAHSATQAAFTVR